MEKYNYRRAITNDVREWIMNDTDIPDNGIMEGRDDDLYNWIEEEIWGEDIVTGNGENYYGTEEFCSECLAGNFDLVYEAVHNMDLDNEGLNILEHYEHKDLARYLDCTIRCYLLLECIYKAVNELLQEGWIKYYAINDSEN